MKEDNPMWLWTYLKVFVVGGAICTVGQLLILRTKLTPARILVGYVTAGVILGAVGLYEPLVDFAAAGLSITPERAQIVDFSIPYATSKQVIIVRNDNTEIGGPDDLSGKTVGVQLGTVADFALEDEEDVTVAKYARYFEAVADLINGRINAIVMDVLPAQEFVGSNPELVILDEELFTDEYAIAIRKGNTVLLDAVNEVLEELIANGKINEFTLNHLR
jgi:polar amino acid transport system substrate-binding protein